MRKPRAQNRTVVHAGLDETEWQQLENDPDFQQLRASKARFIVPALLFFIVYYFSLPILVGYAPELMSRKIVGEVNVAYVFALSQFVMTWTITYLYVRAARDWDKRAQHIVDEVVLGTKP
jgi:uncharacterized membrane protein (DUF485 family)